MPELPEVQTTVTGLRGKIVGLSIENIWNDYDSPYFYGSDNIKDPKYYTFFRKNVIGNEIKDVRRRAKNILIDLSNGYTILVHMKMTGHIMYGDYNKKDPYNRHIRLRFFLSNDQNMDLCDSRRFAKVTLIKTDTLLHSEHIKDIGPEPLEDTFGIENFKRQLYKRADKKIKIVLLDQSIIAGIGNIYADESLWRAGIHPEEKVNNISKKDLIKLLKAIKITLKKGIDFGGDSMSDYRNIHGERGKFQEQHSAYRKTGQKCIRKGCGGTIRRIVIGGRSSHYCDEHQKLKKKEFD